MDVAGVATAAGTSRAATGAPGGSPRAPVRPITFRGGLESPTTRACPYERPVCPSSYVLTMTAFFPAYLPARQITTLPGCRGGVWARRGQRWGRSGDIRRNY